MSTLKCYIHLSDTATHVGNFGGVDDVDQLICEPCSKIMLNLKETSDNPKVKCEKIDPTFSGDNLEAV